MITIQIGAGEALDRISILYIKLEKIEDPEKLKNIRKELSHIEKAVIAEYGIDILDKEANGDYEQLEYYNRRLWDIEDKLREKEKNDDFNSQFITLARQVYIFNDDRAALKKRINLKYNSEFIEEKSYTNYK